MAETPFLLQLNQRRFFPVVPAASSSLWSQKRTLRMLRTVKRALRRQAGAGVERAKKSTLRSWASPHPRCQAQRAAAKEVGIDEAIGREFMPQRLVRSP